jgi:hypothetical protein
VSPYSKLKVAEFETKLKLWETVRHSCATLVSYDSVCDIQDERMLFVIET